MDRFTKQARLALTLGALCCLPLSTSTASAQRGADAPPLLDEPRLAHQYFGNDAPWYLANVPFLEIDDPEIQQVYYYRWQVYRSHLREIGAQGTDETEFLPDVPWAGHPYTDLNDSSSFHILEGRWLRDPTYVTSLVDHLYTGGGNDRHFSESIAAATLGWTEVTGDRAPALRHLDTMQHIFNLWDDHFDASRGLYWIEPLLDATEYTISSIDASGAGFTDQPSKDQNRNGFTGGYAFRPSINAFQFANAQAIAQFAADAGQPQIAKAYADRAEVIRSATLSQLWNPQLSHFIDIYQRSTPSVQAGTSIRGRELVGFVPWQFNLPPTTAGPGRPDYTAAWAHAMNPAELAGPHGLRTVEPNYPKYLQQYRYDAATGLRECQWNGPAWPFQISQTLTGMANLLQAPQQHAVTTNDYVHLLRQYAHLHFDGAGKPDIEEDYDPDTGLPIVGLPRSHHYNHSTFNDLVLSGLIGIRPRAGDTLELNPLLPTGASAERPIRYFLLENLRYHDRDLTLVYDADGSHYHRGKGLSVYAAGQRIYGPAALGHTLIPLAKAQRTTSPSQPPRIDLAVNVWERAPSADEPDLPIAAASSTAAGANPYGAIDGRLWFFPEIPNGWSPDPASNGAGDTWFAIDLRHPQRIHAVELGFFADAHGLQVPTAVRMQTYTEGTWRDIPGAATASPVANGITHLSFQPITSQQLRLVMSTAPGTNLRLIEAEVF